jgi:hypothetical protein
MFLQRIAAPIVLAMGLGAAAPAQGNPLADELSQLLAPHIDPTAKRADSPFPSGTELHSITINDTGVAEINLRLPKSYLDALARSETVFEVLVRAIDEEVFSLPLSGFLLKAWDEQTGSFQPLGFFEPDMPIEIDLTPDLAIPPPSPPIDPDGKAQRPNIANGRPTGSLSNRVVHMNAGHGWTWRSGTTWGVQRGFVFNNVEDMSNADLVHQMLVPYLLNAGAEVFTVRELDPNPNMVIVDNDDSAPAYANNPAVNNYVETGTWTNSSLAGFANGRAPYVRTNTTSDAQNPFSFGTNRLAQCVVGAPTATATWIPTIPEAGFYNVYVSHAAFTNRSPQAHYRIRHAGGETDYFIDQRRYRFTWIFIGRYFFEAGRDVNRASVMLTNSSTSSEHFISADAVRFGGGRGLINRSGNGTSGYARYDEEASYHMQFAGAPTSVHQRTPTDDEQSSWSGRPRFGSWLRDLSTAYGAPAQQHIFLSHHTNATATGTARGIISYINSGLENTIHDRFRRTVHDQIVATMRAGYGGDFVENSNPYRSGSFGEASSTNSGGMPIFLGEWLFHDNERDMALYHDPTFRRMFARGIYQGIVKFYQAEYGGPGTLLPEPPRNFRATVLSSTSVRLDWQAPLVGPALGNGDAATGYLVSRSTHGRAFPPGTPVTGTTTTLTDLTPNTVYFFQLRATNAGGQSFPTETLAVRTSSNNSAPHVLLVSGFDKTDIETRIQTPFSNGILYRQWVDSMNDFSYAVEHARAIEGAGVDVRLSSAEHDAIEAGLVSLSSFDAVVWIGGLQSEVSTADPIDNTALRATTRTALANYLTGGGRLMMSSAALAWDLNRLGQQTYLRNNLRASLSAQATGANLASPSPGSIFSGLQGLNFGMGREGIYTVRSPDVLLPAEGSTTALIYGQAAGTTQVDPFDAIGGWRQPSFSSQTNADPSSSFAIVTSPVRQGSGSARLSYVWGESGNFIRVFNQSLTEFNGASDFSLWVFGDNSGHEVRICLRDSDNDLFVSEWVSLNFTGWQQIRWDDVINNPKVTWVAAAGGDGTMTGPNVRLDSIQMRKVGSQNSGMIYFDDVTAASTSGAPTTGPSAAIQYAGVSRVVYFGFPFESIEGAAARSAVMGRVLSFLLETESVFPAGGWMIR